MKKTKIQWILPLLFAMATVLSFSQIAAAQDQDPPNRVARLNFMQGSVSYQASGDQDWVQADPNRPLTTGDNLWADKDSRGEVHIDSTAIRLSSETGISFLNLDNRTIQLQLAQGEIEVHLRRLSPGDAVEIDTPNLAFTLTQSGEYTIQTDPNGNSTTIVVREGEGQVTGGGESYDLPAGQAYTFTGADQLTYDAQPAPGFDDFENWCQSRDQRENDSPSARYVSRDIDGYYDLDQYGTWQADPEYGEIWVPTGVAAGWAPYHEGHWVFIAPWGWTWVDAEPWGFAPFHYGRWAYVRGYWGWVPGPIVVRPVYAPALVGFVGGGGFGVAVGFGGGVSGVAWFPLGPRDVFVPSYRCSPRYVQNVNVTNTRVVNVTQITNVYNNVTINRTTINNNTSNVTVNKVNYTYENNTKAITAVSKETFVSARPVAKEAVRVTPQQVQSARVVEAKPLEPTRASYMAANAKAATAKPAVAFDKRPVVAKLAPAVSVNRRAIEVTNTGRPAAPAVRTEAEPAARAKTAEPPARTEAAKPVERPATEPPAKPIEVKPADNGFKSFKPAERTNNAPTERNAAPERNVPPPSRNEEPARPAVRFAPPVRAKDQMYDVHPPLNRPQPRPEERRAQPPPRQESKPAVRPSSKPESHPHGKS
ncbi:MAG: DUF6600 domain-containing protein [Candidatus Acidiferrales bacterium]